MLTFPSRRPRRTSSRPATRHLTATPPVTPASTAREAAVQAVGRWARGGTSPVLRWTRRTAGRRWSRSSRLVSLAAVRGRRRRVARGTSWMSMGSRRRRAGLSGRPRASQLSRGGRGRRLLRRRRTQARLLSKAGRRRAAGAGRSFAAVEEEEARTARRKRTRRRLARLVVRMAGRASPAEEERGMRDTSMRMRSPRRRGSRWRRSWRR